MNLWRLALGALLLVVAISLGALLSRAYVAPAAAPPAPAGLTRPAEVNDVGWCPAEQAERLHAYERDGRRCWTCRTFTPHNPSGVDRG